MASATILIVEDNFITSKMMRVTIKTKGYTVLEALDGKTALTMAEEHQPDLIFVDLLLSDMDGLVLTRLLRCLPAGRHTPIIAVSGLQSKLDEARLMRDGFTNFLFKPVTPDTLLEVIEYSLPRAGAALGVHPQGRSMLLVDDDQIQGKFQRLHFEALGYHVTFAHDVETALKAARDTPPDVIVADLIMPRMNGLDLCTQVREIPSLAHIPIVLTSSTFALVGPDELKMAHDAGANTFAPRTPTLQELGQAVLSCLGRPPPQPAPNISTLKEEYEFGLLRQLEHQAGLNQHLVSRCALQSLQLTIHEAVAHSLATKPHLADALNEALAQLLHASGASIGAVYVLEADGSLTLHSHLGFQGMARHDAQNFFGHVDLLRLVLTRGCVVKLPSTEVDLVAGTDLLERAGVAHMLIIPLIANSVPKGALIMSSPEKEVEAIWAGAGQTIGTQLARTVALAQALTEVRESEERYRGLVAATSQIVWTLTSGGMAVEDAPTWRHYSGQSLEEFQNQSWTSVVHHDDQIGVMKAWKLAHSTSTLFEVVCRLRAAQGNYGIFNLRIVPILDSDGHVREWIGACTDITVKIQAEEERDRYFTQARDLIGLVGFDGYFKRLNPAWEACLKFTLDELMAEPYMNLIHSDDVESVQKEVQRLSTGVETISFEIRWLCKDGSHKWIQLNATPLIGQPAFYAYGRDITEQKWLEVQLRQAQKLESIGHLATGIAHEINTPTQFVGDNMVFLSQAFADLGRVFAQYQGLLAAAKTGVCPEALIETCEAVNREAELEYLLTEIPKALEQSKDGMDRVATIVRAMKEFSHPGNKEKTAVNLNKAIESTVIVARNEWKYVADLQTHLDPSLPPVPCLVGEFNQVVLNMIINATHAIADAGKGTGGKGTITISTSHVGDCVEVRIADTGMGIPESIRHKIFDPFFTTKEVGKGTGQGLAIARSVVVDKHGGTITVDSEVGKGTTFVIRLPLTPSVQADKAKVA